MGEFWSWTSLAAAETCTEMASAAHIYGKPILGAEAFTATDNEKWLGHPGLDQGPGRWAFCEGINRFVFHRYALQPWATTAGRHVDGAVGPALRAHGDLVGAVQGLARVPGPLPVPAAAGAVRGRHLLPSAGRRAAMASRRHARQPPIAGYNYDGCTPEVVLTRMTVKDGRIVLPDGMSYRLLVLPESATMTPRAAAQDQATRRGRGDGDRPAAARSRPACRAIRRVMPRSDRWPIRSGAAAR